MKKKENDRAILTGWILKVSRKIKYHLRLFCFDIKDSFLYITNKEYRNEMKEIERELEELRKKK